MTAATDTVTVQKADVVEALAAIHAASGVLCHVLEYDEEVLMEVRDRLRHELLPTNTTEDDWFETEPMEVEIWARSSEIEADVLEEYSESAANAVRREHAKRIKTNRVMAPRYRERGTMNLEFVLHEPRRSHRLVRWLKPNPGLRAQSG